MLSTLKYIWLLFFAVIYITLGYSSFGQTYDYEKILSRKPKQQQVYDTTSIGVHQYFLSMDFAQHLAKNNLVIDELRLKRIKGIELIYTQYRRSESFSQYKLNLERCNMLDQVVPGIQRQTGIKWRVIEQTACKSTEECADFFHGFVIHYLDPEEVSEMRNGTFETREEEISALDSLLSVMLGDKNVDSYDTIGNSASDTIHNDTDRGKFEKKEGVINNQKKVISEDTCFTRRYQKRIWTGNYIPKSILVRLFKPVGKKRTMFDRPKEYKYDWKEKEICRKKKRNNAGDLIDLSKSKYKNNHVITSLNKYANVEETIIVVDVTGSMYSHTAEVLTFVKLTVESGRARKFVFFNDGDHKPENRKVMGNVGGVYMIESDSYAEIKAEAKKAMRNGSGGDAEENDIEAIVKGCWKWGGANTVILVCDNMAPADDLLWIKKIPTDVQVNIIPCNPKLLKRKPTEKGYAALAKSRNGTIHQMKIIPKPKRVKKRKTRK